MGEGIRFCEYRAVSQDSALCQQPVDAVHPFLQITAAALQDKTFLTCHCAQLLFGDMPDALLLTRRRFRTRKMNAVIHMGHFKRTGNHIAVPNENTAVYITLEPADPFQIQQIQRSLRDGIDILVQFVVDYELPKLPVGTHIGGNHHAVQTVGHIDEISHGDKLVCEALFAAQILKNAVHNGALTAVHSIQPLGKEVQLIQSGAVQPETRQLGKGAAMLNADITDTIRIRIPIGPFLCFRDFFCTGRQVKVCITIAGFIFSNQLNQNLFAHAHTSLHRHSEVLGFFHRRLCHNEKAVFI